MNDIVDHIKCHSIILFNESFAAINEREGSKIARQIIRALLDKAVKVVCVTHLYELAHGFYEAAAGTLCSCEPIVKAAEPALSNCSKENRCPLALAKIFTTAFCRRDRCRFRRPHPHILMVKSYRFRTA